MTRGMVRFGARAASGMAVLILVGCRTRPATSETATPPSSTALPEPVLDVATKPETPQQEEAGPPAATLEPSQTWSFQKGELLARPLHASYPEAALRTVRVKLAAKFGRDTEVWAMLDDGNPRPVVSGAPLSSLHDEMLELAPGGHRLVLFRLLPSARAVDYQMVHFQTESTAKPDAATVSAEQGCLLLSPRGTINGATSADSVLLLALPLSAGVEKVHYQVEGGSKYRPSTIEVATGVGVRAISMSSGDYEISAQCHRADGTSERSSARNITVNRELETTP